MRDFSPDPEELFRDSNDRIDRVGRNIPKQQKIGPIPLWHSHSKVDLKRQINTANDSARQAKENAELELKYGDPPDKWLRDLRANDHKFHAKSKAMEDRVDARPNLPVENLLEGMGKAAKIFTPSEIKGLLGK